MVSTRTTVFGPLLHPHLVSIVMDGPQPLLSLSSIGTAAAGLRLAAQQAAQDDLTRRSDSPVANSPSKTGGGSASVSGERSSLAVAAATSEREGELNTGAGVSKDGTQAPTDSITLGQLKQITAAFPKPKVRIRVSWQGAGS